MKVDILFGLLARSSMRLSTGLLLSLGLVFLLLLTNFRAVELLLDSEQEKAAAHFARIMGNVREQEAFLQSISDKLKVTVDGMVMAPANIKETWQFSDAARSVYEVADGSFLLPFTMVVEAHSDARIMEGVSSVGWHLTNFYGRFWAQSPFLSPQVFVVSPESPSSLAVPALGKFHTPNLLTRQNYNIVFQHVLQQAMKSPAPTPARGVHWIPSLPSAQQGDGANAVVAYIGGELPANRIRSESKMRHVVVAVLSDLQHLGGGTQRIDLPFYGAFALIGADGKVLSGHVQTPVDGPGFTLSGNGLSISIVDNASPGESWAAQYHVDYKSLARWAMWPLIRLIVISFLLFFGFKWLYRRYLTRIVEPAACAHHQLIETQAFNRSVIESAPAGLVVVKTADGEVMIENQRAQNNPGVTKAIAQMLRKPGASISGEACMAIEGRYYLTSYSSAHYQDEAVLLCAFSDVTEHRERSKALRQAKLGAEKANEAKTIFLATMSHEIRTPLYGVLGTLELLALTALDDRQRGYIQTIRSSSATVLQIISDVLDVAKIESGQLTMDSVTFSPLDLIEEALASHVANAYSKGLQIYAWIDPAIPNVLCGDAVRTGQILANLLSNAVKFTHVGRVVLRCRVLNNDGQRLTLEFQVADTGIGITAEQQLRLFEPFYQARTSNLVSGTGLGLSICSRFVELMAGEIDVISEQGLGSSFTVRLPFTQPDTREQEATQIDLEGSEVYVRAPIGEIADNICAWLIRWGANATVVSARHHDRYRNALLVDVLGEGDATFSWRGRRLTCEHTGPLIPELTETGLRVSAHHRRAIANSILIENIQGTALVPQPSSDSLPVLGLHILVAEDNLINQAILKEQLEALGCSVLLAGDGQQALELWDRERFDVVLSDANMPVLNGYELAQAIRQKGSRVPIIGITANAMRDEGKRCVAAGMNSWMVKPLSLTNLLATLAHVEAIEGNKVSTLTVRQVAGNDEVRETIVLSEAMRSLLQQTLTRDMQSIRSALLVEHLTEVIQKLHSISGALAVIRADRLSSIFGLLEHRVRDQGFDASLWSDINSALELLAGFLKAV